MYSDWIIIGIASIIVSAVIIGSEYLQYRWHMYREMKRVKRELRRTRQQ
jgi:uncharacterized membrane protein YciS (DUF1049 family)